MWGRGGSRALEHTQKTSKVAGQVELALGLGKAVIVKGRVDLPGVASCLLMFGRKKKCAGTVFWLLESFTSASLTPYTPPPLRLSVLIESWTVGTCLPVLLTTLIMPTTFALDGLEVRSIGHLRQELVVVEGEPLSKDSGSLYVIPRHHGIGADQGP